MAKPTTTAQRVFDLTMGLMGEVNESSGATDTTDTKEYKQRALFILNTLRGELYLFSDTYKVDEAGKRPISPVIEKYTDVIQLDDTICQSVMPYGLAAHLLLTETPDAASFFQQRYEDLIAKLASKVPTGSEDIQDVYGGIEYGNFSHW